MSVIRFPSRRSAVWIVHEAHGSVCVVYGSHGWLYGSRADAVVAALHLAAIHQCPIREQA
jgi:hypothetical protein